MSRSRSIIGYTCGVFDLFHIGHLNLLNNSKGLCDKLIVGVSTDELALYKNKKPIIRFEDRLEIIKNIKSVDSVIPQDDLDKFKMWEKIKFDRLFVGDDWFNHPNWKNMENKFKDVYVKIIYLPYTNGISSTVIRNKY